jgi:hypothetical protein
MPSVGFEPEIKRPQTDALDRAATVIGYKDFVSGSYQMLQMGVSGQRHAPAALYSQGKDPRYPLYRRLGGPQSRSGHRG